VVIHSNVGKNPLGLRKNPPFDKVGKNPPFGKGEGRDDYSKPHVYIGLGRHQIERSSVFDSKNILFNHHDTYVTK
jgi:hypothetical protein